MVQNPIVLVVSVSIIKDEEVLMIKENKPNVINKWNFPSGRIETGEDILYNGINYIFDDEETILTNLLPFNPLKDSELYKECMDKNLGIQFSHTIEEHIGGQLKAGFILTDLYEDTNGTGRLHKYNVPTFVATRKIKSNEIVRSSFYVELRNLLKFLIGQYIQDFCIS